VIHVHDDAGNARHSTFAALRSGPQQIAMVDGKPGHQAADDEHAVQISSGKDRICEAALGLHSFLCGFNCDRKWGA
jgi:hypothetical protein